MGKCREQIKLSAHACPQSRQAKTFLLPPLLKGGKIVHTPLAWIKLRAPALKLSQKPPSKSDQLDDLIKMLVLEDWRQATNEV